MGCVTFTKATGASNVEQAQFSSEVQDTMRVLSGQYTSLCSARRAKALAHFFNKA